MSMCMLAYLQSLAANFKLLHLNISQRLHGPWGCCVGEKLLTREDLNKFLDFSRIQYGWWQCQAENGIDRL